MRYILLTATLLTGSLFALACGTTEKSQTTPITPANAGNSTLTTSQATLTPDANANLQTTTRGDRDDANRGKTDVRRNNEQDNDDRRNRSSNANARYRDEDGDAGGDER